MSRPTRGTASGRAFLDLQNRARRERRGTQELLTLYVVERWLARLARSPYADDFVLKGGMLLAAFGQRRPTVDADALARNMARDEATVAARVSEIASISDPEDGVEFLTHTITTHVIRDDALYSGVRVAMQAQIATAAVKLRLDVNFGDPVTPAPQRISLPSLRPDAPPIDVLGYRVETVLAEKISTAIELGAATTRVRDFADIYTLTGSHDVDFDEMRTALVVTSTFRGTDLRPLSDAVGALVGLRSRAYTAYRQALGTYGAHLPQEFSVVVAAASTFADPLASGTDKPHRWRSDLRVWGG
jgi:hypothetical protein